ncbi:hypothetical protein [Microbacterium lacticum]|uniref:Uncharacterized protein n=1 Tax=Microbacterium lacticum TaxID=33885 RepID=A0A4Y3UKI5_9MICO|nr:hypothetical protein [Microbacterium lacticum]TQN00729.1 hypothetical protein FHX68_0847 [Microbacterium lacticum]GEB93990.1 hypothetical protein MLA01_02090 [Microbacterium lacticum]GGN13921.1 hypothetical protein GCM10009724_04210 [Microbacterium lacticum]
MSANLLIPRPYLAIQQVTVEPDGTRSAFVRVHTRSGGVIIKKLPAGENHQPLLPFLQNAHLLLPKSYQHYRLVWGTGAGLVPTTYTLRHDSRDEGVTNDHLLSSDFEDLWGADNGPDFLDARGSAIPRDEVDLIGVYPELFLTNDEAAFLRDGGQ